MNPIINKYLQKINHQNKNIKIFNDLCESHPNYPSLLATTDSLSVLEIENISANVPFQHFDKLPNIFLTRLNHIDDLILLKKSNDKFYIEKEKSNSESISLESIKQNWNGFIFIIEENENNENKALGYFQNKWILYTLTILILFFIKERFLLKVLCIFLQRLQAYF